MSDRGVLIGVDVGGTFTDAVVIDQGKVFRAKSPSTNPNVQEGVMNACRLAAEAAGRDFGALLGEVGRFGLGTTAVTNVIATRSGLKVGLITTRGFEDTLRAARARVRLVDGWQQPPPSLVHRDHIVGLDERIDRHGKVLRPLDVEAVIAAGHRLVDEAKVEALTISFLWSFVNPAHERAALEALRAEFPKMWITSAAELRPVFREYERTTLAVLNAYSRGAFTGIELLAEELRAAGLKVPILICHSGGGTISIGQVREQPVWLAASGPAAGVSAAAALAHRHGEAKALTCDLGGTSFDVGHVHAGEPARVQRGDLMGIWTALPRVDVESVGAGGGSIAWIDARGMLRVGPKSAGSSPGPVCYGRGGTEPTLTDALLVLGYIDPERFLGGRMSLDRVASLAACERLGRSLGFSGLETAWGIREIALAEMTQAARARLAVNALAAQEHAVVSYGGCGSLFTVEVAQAIGARRVLAPEIASVLSAFGAATMTVRRERLRSVMRQLPVEPELIDQAFTETTETVRADLLADGVPESEIEVGFEADMRFAGQRWEVTIALPAAPVRGDGGRELQAIFESEYRRRYGAAAARASSIAELVAIRAVGVGGRSAGLAEPAHIPEVVRRPAQGGRPRLIQVERAGAPTEVQAFDASELGLGDTVTGPALVDNGDTTTWIPVSTEAWVAHDRTLIVETQP